MYRISTAWFCRTFLISEPEYLLSDWLKVGSGYKFSIPPILVSPCQCRICSQEQVVYVQHKYEYPWVSNASSSSPIIYTYIDTFIMMRIIIKVNISLNIVQIQSHACIPVLTCLPTDYWKFKMKFPSIWLVKPDITSLSDTWGRLVSSWISLHSWRQLHHTIAVS